MPKKFKVMNPGNPTIISPKPTFKQKVEAQIQQYNLDKQKLPSSVKKIVGFKGRKFKVSNPGNPIIISEKKVFSQMMEHVGRNITHENQPSVGGFGEEEDTDGEEVMVEEIMYDSSSAILDDEGNIYDADNLLDDEMQERIILANIRDLPAPYNFLGTDYYGLPPGKSLMEKRIAEEEIPNDYPQSSYPFGRHTDEAQDFLRRMKATKSIEDHAKMKPEFGRILKKFNKGNAGLSEDQIDDFGYSWTAHQLSFIDKQHGKKQGALAFASLL